LMVFGEEERLEAPHTSVMLRQFSTRQRRGPVKTSSAHLVGVDMR
jgi:hypothetical protein